MYWSRPKRRLAVFPLVVVLAGTGGLGAVATAGADTASAPTAGAAIGKARAGVERVVAKDFGSGPAAVAAPAAQRGWDRLTSAEDRAAKAAATRAVQQSGAKSGTSAAVPAPLAPPTLQTINAAGVGQAAACGGCRPPDTHGAVGDNHYLQVVNTRVVVWNKASPPGLVKSTALNTFFGSTEFVFDPRAVYDPVWDRFVVVATRRSTSGTDPTRRFFVAVSRTSNPAAGWFVYTMFFNGIGDNTGVWLDYPQLGYDQDAILMTGNWFDESPSQFVTAGAFSIPKAHAYNGLVPGFPIFTGLVPTVAPPILSPFDRNRGTFFVSASAALDRFSLYRMEDTEGPDVSLVLQANVAATLNVPPNAPQPGTTVLLDTLDGRIQNNTVQRGALLHIVRTDSIGSFAAPRYYALNTATNTLAVNGDSFFASGTSHDFNPSVAVNTDGDVFITYSATDPPAGAAGRPMVRATGKLVTDADIPGGFTVFTSPGVLTSIDRAPNVSRWGDYSSASVDPANKERAWITNEVAVGPGSVWATRIARIGFA